MMPEGRLCVARALENGIQAVQCGAQCTMPSTPAGKIRLTISVSPEVHQTFQRLAKAGNMSISSAMGEWLGDTLEAVEFMTKKMEEARAAPRVVMREMHAYALGLADETGALLERVRQEGKTARAGRSSDGRPGRSVPIPPVGNTGGKGREPNTKGRAP